MILLLASLAFADDLCGSKTPPAGYRIVVGYASGPRAKAIEAAREKALANAESLYAGQLTPLQRAAFREQVFDWSDDNWKAGTACFKLAIDNAAFTADEAELAALTAQLRTLGAAVGSRAVDVEAPVWDQSGCAADIGGAIRTTLLSEMHGATVTSGAARLSIRLAALADRVQGSATLDGVAIGGVSFPLTLFRLEPGEVGRCAGNAALRLASDDRKGSSGLSVRVRLTDHRGEACEGEADSPAVTTSGPARVQVYSVDQSGGGHYIGLWSVPGELSLGTGWLTPMAEGGDERLVAVAVPAKVSFGRTESWGDTYCRLTAPFDASSFPPEAAIGTTTFIVHPGGTHGCPVAKPTPADTAPQVDCPVPAPGP
jgi:hypothetical protein